MIKVRQNVFETNSSSTHSITMCMEDTFNKWKNGELYFNHYEELFLSEEEMIEHIRKEDGEEAVSAILDAKQDSVECYIYELYNWGLYTMKSYRRSFNFDHFTDSFTTPSGETIYAFGFYGQDY